MQFRKKFVWLLADLVHCAILDRFIGWYHGKALRKDICRPNEINEANEKSNRFDIVHGRQASDTIPPKKGLISRKILSEANRPQLRVIRNKSLFNLDNQIWTNHLTTTSWFQNFNRFALQTSKWFMIIWFWFWSIQFNLFHNILNLINLSFCIKETLIFCPENQLKIQTTDRSITIVLIKRSKTKNKTREYSRRLFVECMKNSFNS